MKHKIIQSLIISLFLLMGTILISSGATILFPYQGGTGSPNAPTNGQLLIGNGSGLYNVSTLTAGSNITVTNASGSITIASTGGGGGGTTTTIAGLQPATDIFFLTSTSGIAITTSSPATIQFNLGTATTTQLAITSLAGQTGCLSVDATGKVATSTCSGGAGITSLGGQTGSTQTFSTSTDTNIQLRIVSSANDHQFTPVWAGTLADGRITSANTWNAKITTSSLSVAYPPLAFNNTTGVFSLPTSTASQSGFLSSGDWTIFNNKQATITDGTGLTFTGATLNCDTASGSIQGCLASADWTTFNSKQNNLTFPLVYASTTHLTATSPLLITAGDLSLTGRLSTINSIATTTGNLIVGRTDTTGWYGLLVGANGKVLMASSTATDGVSWETVVASASAGGANTNIQVNEAGAITGYAGFNYSSSTQMLTVGTTTISGLVSCDTIDTDGNGKLACGTDGGGSGGVSTSTPFSAGYIPFATSSSAITNSNIFQSGSNVGIGTTTPASLLDVAGTVQLRGFSTSTTGLYVDGSGKVGIGEANPTKGLDVVSGGTDWARVGIQLSNVNTNSTEKQARFKTRHYNNSEEPLSMIIAASKATENSILIGGGTSYENAATYISLYTAANNTTLTGTERVRIDSTGNIGIGTTTPASILHILGANSSSTVSIGSATNAGCIIMGDTDLGGITYITALNGVLSATTTKPSVCK